MTRFALIALALVACGGKSSPAPSPTATVAVDAYAAKDSNTNSYVVYDGQGAIVIDATKTAEDGAAVVARIKAHAPTGPVTVLITHGHPDHFLGLGTIRAAFPQARFVVATPEIKADLLWMVGFMVEQHWLDGFPAMQPKTDAHPDGFDYQGEIGVLDGPLTLPGGAGLELRTDYPATEAAHMTTAYSPDLNALFTGDLAYSDVHLWLGIGVTRASAQAWQSTLDELDRTWTDKHPTVYPGHGLPTDTAVFAADKAYIGDLLAVTASAPTDADAIAQMAAKYPDYANRDFLLMMSVANMRQQK